VTRGRLPQRAGLPGLNGGGAAAAVPPNDLQMSYREQYAENQPCTTHYKFYWQYSIYVSATVFRKHPLSFSSYLQEYCVDFHKITVNTPTLRQNGRLQQCIKQIVVMADDVIITSHLDWIGLSMV